MSQSKKKFEEKKNRETERVLQKIIGGININRIRVIRFDMWASGNKINVTIQYDHRDDDDE